MTIQFYVNTITQELRKIMTSNMHIVILKVVFGCEAKSRTPSLFSPYSTRVYSLDYIIQMESNKISNKTHIF